MSHTPVLDGTLNTSISFDYINNMLYTSRKERNRLEAFRDDLVGSNRDATNVIEAIQQVRAIEAQLVAHKSYLNDFKHNTRTNARQRNANAGQPIRGY